MLGNVGVFVDACVDPETLTHSQAALAKALVRQGLVAEAMRGGGDGLPLLRGITAQTLAGVAAEEQVIVFAERVWCLRQLARTLARTPRRGGARRRRPGQATRVRGAQARLHRPASSPCCACPGSARRATTSKTPRCLMHLDLPWLPSGLEQRVGRAARPGAARGWVQTYIPYIRGAGVEHIVSILSPRGAEHHAVLDSFEGVAANQSTVATQLGADHRPGSRRQARRRLRRHRGPPAGRRERVRHLNARLRPDGPRGPSPHTDHVNERRSRMSAIDAALSTIDRVASEGDLAPERPSDVAGA